MKIRRLLTLLLVVLSMAMFSCKKDGASTTTGGGSNPINPTNCDDPEGTITANLRNDSGYITVLNGTLKMNTADNFEFNSQSYHERTFVNIGEVDGLGCVENIPQSGWSNQVAVIPGNGYVVKDKYEYYPDDKYTKYARIYVTRYILSANYEILGAELKYQDNWCAEPSITTKDVTEITQTTAVCGGIIDGGGNAVTERGICWKKNSEPTINDSHLYTEENTNDYEFRMTGLDGSSMYYVKAYIKSDKGVISYGNTKTFITLSAPVNATVTTNQVTNITTTSATCYGYVTDDAGFYVSERGICWNNYGNPNVNGSHKSAGSGAGEFSVTLNNLSSETTYYVRAYATNAAGTSYGDVVSFTTPHEWYDGILPGEFSVSDTKRVKFSQGNLQYRASIDTWRFAGNQYDIVGVDNTNISPTYNGWIDLFGWGTSGWNNGNVFYHPYDSDNVNGAWYGPSGEYDLTGNYANSDWGVYNAISNGGNTAGMWRTLTRDEWNYLINQRNTLYGIRFAKATVNGVCGLILLPDDWIPSNYSLSNMNNGNASFSSNGISQSDWTNLLEANGAVFLPAAGYRGGTSVDRVGSYGYYWSSTFHESYANGAYGVNFNSGYLSPQNDIYRFLGLSVRLVIASE